MKTTFSGFLYLVFSYKKENRKQKIITNELLGSGKRVYLCLDDDLFLLEFNIYMFHQLLWICVVFFV